MSSFNPSGLSFRNPAVRLKWYLLGMTGFICFRMESYACQPCVIFELPNPTVRILSNESTVGNDIPVPRAQIRIFQTKEIPPGRQPRQSLSCLTYHEIGKQIWSGKTDKNGIARLEHIPNGEYWMAIKSRNEYAVYVVRLPPDRKPAQTPTVLKVSDIGLVLNKCDIEPINYFFH
jgi:hypothetical protein